jgi:hypothetical protein
MTGAAEQQSVRRVFLLSLAGLAGAGLAVGAVLWWRYGTTVFFETIRTGLTNCFG